MRIHDFNVARDSGIMNVVITLKGIGLSFDKIAEIVSHQFDLSLESSEEEVRRYENYDTGYDYALGNSMYVYTND